LIETLPADQVENGNVTFSSSAPKSISISAIAKPAGIEQGPLVGHFVFSGDANIAVSNIPQNFMQAVVRNADTQSQEVQPYSEEIQDKTLFYVIKKEEIQGKPSFMVSYAWGGYRNDLVTTMYWRLVLVMLAFFILSWIPSLVLSRYLTRPLVEMEANIARITEREWHKPFILNRKDEIGRLAHTFENMRVRLVKQDEAQQSFLQNISHELKTPVMVIRSYANSILDGIYPNETLDRSIAVIDQEALRLEKRIKDLLFLNKLKYLETKGQNDKVFNLSTVICQIVERFRCIRADLQWEVNLPVIMVDGNQEQWRIAVENILDNQIRYAVSKIKIEKIADQTATILRIYNDGEPIPAEARETIFETFKTGSCGDFGLGLAIVKQIVNGHHGDIRVETEAGGTAFYISLRPGQGPPHT
jgi:two-component system sensor histidine kinase CssS